MGLDCTVTNKSCPNNRPPSSPQNAKSLPPPPIKTLGPARIDRFSEAKCCCCCYQINALRGGGGEYVGTEGKVSWPPPEGQSPNPPSWLTLYTPLLSQTRIFILTPPLSEKIFPILKEKIKKGLKIEKIHIHIRTLYWPPFVPIYFFYFDSSFAPREISP